MSLLVLAGIIGFFVMAVALALRLCGFVLRTLFGAPAAPPQRTLFRAQDGPIICPHRRCGHANHHNARFCGRCGRPLRGGDHLDAYA